MDPLQLYWIYVESKTIIKIDKDKKTTLEAMISLIGGTMGLFTGFSIFSAIEILYFIAKCVRASRVAKKVGDLSKRCLKKSA